KKAIGTKWVYRNKKDKRGIVVRNKARLVAQGHRQEEGIDYNEVFALMDKIKAIKIFLAFASFMRFIVYQMDVKSAFLYSTIEDEVYVSQPPGFIDLQFPNKVYKVEKALYGLHQALGAWNKKDKRGIVVRNKARLVAQGHKQEERIDYDEVFALVDRIETIRIFLAFASFMGFIVYQMDVKSAFLYDTIEDEVYVSQPPDFIDPQFLNKVYKVEKALYGLHQALKAWEKATLNEPTPQGEGSGSGPGCRENIGGAMAQIRSEGALIHPIDPPLLTGYTVRSGEDKMEHDMN
nr:copia protein [Tanacetum cinerariifolium]